MSNGGRDPSDRERAIGLLVIGLVLALATPLLLPAGVAAVVVSQMLVRRGYNGFGAGGAAPGRLRARVRHAAARD